MLHVLLYEPQIPPNTGNVMRLCANSGATLHLIGPLGFELDNTRLKRAGLDYRHWADVRQHDDLDQAQQAAGIQRIYAFTTKATQRHSDVRFAPGDGLLFGPETRGLPSELLVTIPDSRCLRLPMLPDNRSLNLSNSVAVSVYEAWRQNDFAGAS